MKMDLHKDHIEFNKLCRDWVDWFSAASFSEMKMQKGKFFNKVHMVGDVKWKEDLNYLWVSNADTSIFVDIKNDTRAIKMKVRVENAS